MGACVTWHLADRLGLKGHSGTAVGTLSKAWAFITGVFPLKFIQGPTYQPSSFKKKKRLDSPLNHMMNIIFGVIL